MIDETNLIKAVLKSMENDRHLTHEASEVHFQEHRYLLNLIEKQPKVKIDGNTSDGYHTFNELYHHRAILFSVICNQNKEIAWKSKQHHDGSMYDGMFIVGVETPQGQYSYHYDIEPYWDIFNVKELEFAPEWDGHEPKDVDRLLSIGNNPPLKFEELKEDMWIWDNKYKDYVIFKRNDNENVEKIIIFSKGGDEEYLRMFKENRFYRREVKEDE